MKFPTNHLCVLIGWLMLVNCYIVPEDDLPKTCVKCHDTDPEKINVHMVSHSHDDAGWLKTMDQYFWGLKNYIQYASVQVIITSVVNALWDHPDRRFVQVETAFFWMWWQNNNDEMRNKFKTLVDNGQIEIINGGWVMNDEACVNYQSTIDQYAWGLRTLKQTLGKCGLPVTGWQIDAFGHSSAQASIMYKMGFHGVFFARLDEHDRRTRKENSDMDLLWKTSANNDSSFIFTSMFGSDKLYIYPQNFCPECGGDEIYDDPSDERYNLNSKAKELAENIEKYATYFKTNHIIITMGGDFTYHNAEHNFEYTEKLIRAFEHHPQIKLLYSTPTCYLRAVYAAKPNLTVKTDDFFPYSEPYYWAGFYTSRQNFKRFERISHNVLQVAKQLTSLASAEERTEPNEVSLRALREAMGVVQHHDSITGTAKQHVADDYTKILHGAVTEAESVFTHQLGRLLNIDNLDQYTSLSSCHLSNMSICTTSQNSATFIVVVYNPLSRPVSYPVRLPVEGTDFTVLESEGEVDYDIVPAVSDFSYVKIENAKPAPQSLVFIASDIPALGVKSFHVTRNNSTQMKGNSENSYIFGDDELGFELDSSTNLLKSVTMNGQTLQIRQEFLYYTGNPNKITSFGDPSGAYIFRPDGRAIPFETPKIVSMKKGGPVEDEVLLRFNDYISQVIRVYKYPFNFIEFDWLVGPLNVSSDVGYEIISRFTVSDFHNDKTFYTDSNGREMIKRVLNFRPTYQYDSSNAQIEGNYYPVTSKIVIRDEYQGLEVAVLNDRSQGGSSLDEGQIELMIHRRTTRDDFKGVGEPLNETEFGQGIVARGSHYLVFGPSEEILYDGNTVTAQERLLQQELLLQPWVGVGDARKLPEDILSKLIKENYSGLKRSLPENINILTLEPWIGSSYLLRLEHVLEKHEDPFLSDPVTVDLTVLFSGFKITEVTEMALGGDRPLNNLARYDWTYRNDEIRETVTDTADNVVLEPMDIKTFIVTIA